MENKEEILYNICSCKIFENETKCSNERYAETGFCTLYFTRFTFYSFEFQLNDSVKDYLNTQSIIF